MPVENPVQNLEEWADYVDEDGNIIEGEDDVHPAMYAYSHVLHTVNNTVLFLET